jgi:hypothetical protein
VTNDPVFKYTLPNFLIIGAMKAGTTSLHTMLGRHPEINLCRRKEPNFFNVEGVFKGNWGMGLDWYSNLFDQRPGVRGEASPSYSKHPRSSGTPQRIASVIPDAKFIYLTRNPVDRVISHYFHNVFRRRENRPIREALSFSEKSNYVNTSLYHMQLRCFLEVFPRDRFLVLTAERLWRNPAAELLRVTNFLNIAPFVSDRNPIVRANSSEDFITDLEKNGPKGEAQENLLRTFRFAGLDPTCGTSSLASALGFDKEHRSLLACHFRADVALMEEFLSSDLREWKDDFLSTNR